MYEDNYKGCILNSFIIGNFRITETYYAKDSKLIKHVHSNAILSIVENGDFTESISTNSFRIKSFDILYKPPFTQHSNFFSGGAKCLNIELPDVFIKKTERLGLDMKKVFYINNLNNSNLLTHIKDELKNRNPFSEKILEGILYEIFKTEYLKNQQSSTKIPGWIQTLLNEINNSNYDLSLNDLSHITKKHPVYIINSFKKYFNTTPGEYLRKLKFKMICNELINTDKTLADIVFQFNFFDESHFYKFFKKYTGNTPSNYRQIYKS